jgi:hypothetical protein
VGHQLIKQPNGLLCFSSSVTDSINGFDFTAEDYIEQEAARAAFDTAVRVYQKALKVYADKPAYHQFTLSWDEMVRPAPCDCGQCHACAGFPPCDCGDYQPCAEAENQRTPEGEVVEWIANIEQGNTADGEGPPEFKPLELRRAKMCDDVVGVYRETESARYEGNISKGESLLEALRAVLHCKACNNKGGPGPGLTCGSCGRG